MTSKKEVYPYVCHFMYSNLSYHQMLLFGAVTLFNEPAKVRNAHINFASEKTFVLYRYLGNIDLLLQLLYKVDIREIQKGSNERLQTVFFFSFSL